MGGRVPGGLPRGIAVLSAAALLGLATALPAAAQPVPPTSTRIVGGTAAEISDYPWVVALTTKTGLFCGGTLTAPDEVVTAAHCAQAYPAMQVEVIAGRTKLTGKGGTVVKVARFEVHPEWNPITLYGDIAVARLAEPLTGPTLPLATDADSALYTAGTVGTVLGWGRTSENGSLSKGLRRAELPITSDSSCKLAYPVGFNAKSSFCAGYAKGEVDSCQGDSGGPFVVADKLVGIVSYGEGCARPGRPGIYTRVSAFAQ